jgi:glycosyltransferase involved in cell wall biosynthesis
MHIGLISLDYPSTHGSGGVGTFVQTLARALVGRGHAVTVVALKSDGQPFSANDAGVRVIRVRQDSIHWYVSKLPVVGPWLALTVRELERAWRVWQVVKKFHREEPFDVLELTEQAGFFIAMRMGKVALVARLHGERYTIVRHTPELPLTIGIRMSRAVQRIALRRVRRLVSPSKAHANEIATELGLGHPPIQVIPNAVKIQAFQPGIPSRRSSIQHQTEELHDSPNQLVLYTGRLEACKGIVVLLKAAAIVLKDDSAVQFVLAGAYHPTLSKRHLSHVIQDLGLGGAVHLLGHVAREELVAWYRRATLCVLPSYYETFGIAVLEPMLFGVPVVATRVGALPELVEDGVTGVLVPPGDSNLLAESIVRVLGNKDLQKKMGAAGKKRAYRWYSNEGAVSLTVAMYENLLCKSDYHARVSHST